MRDLTNPSSIKFKAVLFLILELLSCALLLAARPTLRTALLLALAVWSLCRCYYFAFYVIEHYIDPSFRFSGLLSSLSTWSRTQGRTLAEELRFP